MTTKNSVTRTFDEFQEDKAQQRNSATTDSDQLTRVNQSRRSPEDEEIIRRGLEAFQRQQSAKHALQNGWQDWLTVAEVLVVGRTTAMTMAGTDEPRGSRYNKAIDMWLVGNGFKDLPKDMRSKLLKCWEYRDEIEKWRSSLTEQERLRCNHPNTVIRKFESRNAKLPEKKPKKPTVAKLEESVQRLEDENFTFRRHVEKTDPTSPLLKPEQEPTAADHFLKWKEYTDYHYPRFDDAGRIAATEYILTLAQAARKKKRKAVEESQLSADH